MNMSTDLIKCGEIFWCGLEEFLIKCDYCSEHFNSKSDAFHHLLKHFQKTKEVANKAENIKIEIEDNFSEIIDSRQDDIDDKKLLVNKYESTAIDQPSTSHTDVIYSDNQSNRKIDIDKKALKPIGKQGRKHNFKWGSYSSKMSMVSCDICGSSLKKMNINRHMILHCKVNFVCEICNRNFHAEQNLKKHRKIHLLTKNLRKFCCDYCGSQFYNKYNLDAHTRTHTGEKPYKCSVCDKRFCQSSALINHMRTHTGEKPFSCDVCGNCFATSSHLKNHKLRHFNDRKYKCNTCDRAFYSPSSLKVHSRVHTGERPYICKICDKAFKRIETYKQHAHLHSGIKSYKCRHCDLTFTQGPSRRTHERSVHKDLEHLIK